MDGNSVQKIGRYEIERELGRGGMAVVYKAKDTRLDRPVAIKLIQTDAFATKALGSIRERFEREAKALARLDHPNIVKVYDYGEYKGAPYLVMDYLDGATLKELKKPVRVDTAVRLLTPIADALEYVHRHGLLHRDIKPSNIMMTSENRLVLTDFGIVKWLEDDDELHTLTATGVGIGTPEYMSPEQGRGKKVDARSDMYSLSIVFFELITGRKPFTGDTPVDILLRQISEPIPDPSQFAPNINPSVKKFLDRAAAKDPADRYPSTKEYLLDLEGLRLQAQANRASSQSSSGLQSLQRKTVTLTSSVEIGKSGLREVRAKADEASAQLNETLSHPQPKPTKRFPWRVFAFAAALVVALIVGFFSLQSWTMQQELQKQEARLARLTADAGETESAAQRTSAEFETRANGTATTERFALMQTETSSAELAATDTAWRDALRETKQFIANATSKRETEFAHETEQFIAAATAERETQSAHETEQFIANATAERETEFARETEQFIAVAASKRGTQSARETEQFIANATAKRETEFARETEEAIAALTAMFAAQQTESARTQETKIAALTAYAQATQAVASALTATQAAKGQVGNIKVGDTLNFGRYEQDNNKNNGAEPIEWDILAIENDRALLLSKYGLDAKPYHVPGGNITWENCTLRAWLNGEFYKSAFNEKEQDSVALTHLINEDNRWNITKGGKGGNDTEDYVFLLSYSEYKSFRNSINNRVFPTNYASANGAFIGTNWRESGGWWWLRTPGEKQFLAMSIYVNSIRDDSRVHFLSLSVRPALWVNLTGLESVIEKE